jgi:hypothetical protein
MTGHTVACTRAHGVFEWCYCCARPGVYYFGERISDFPKARNRNRGYTRAETLELVLEAIEREHADGSTFTTFGLTAGIWGGRVYAPLRWLEHIGIIARVPKPSNQLNEWFVVGARDSPTAARPAYPGNDVERQG